MTEIEIAAEEIELLTMFAIVGTLPAKQVATLCFYFYSIFLKLQSSFISPVPIALKSAPVNTFTKGEKHWSKFDDGWTPPKQKIAWFCMVLLGPR